MPPPWTTRRGVRVHDSDVSTASMARGLVTTSEDIGLKQLAEEVNGRRSAAVTAPLLL